MIGNYLQNSDTNLQLQFAVFSLPASHLSLILLKYVKNKDGQVLEVFLKQSLNF